MSVASTLDTALTTLLGKAQGTITGGGGSSGGGSSGGGGVIITPTTSTSLVTVNITFSGGGAALPSAGGLPGVVEIPGPLTLVWVHMFAGDETGDPSLVTAAVDLRLTSEGSFGGASPIYGSTLPRIQADAIASVDLTGWRTNFTTGDAILYRLDSFSGSATWLTVSMQMRPTVTILGQNTLVDNTATGIVDNAGNPVVTRS